MDIKVKIAYKNDKLQETRLATGMSQGTLAKEAQVNLRILQCYEQGNRDINSAKLSTLLKICNTLECKMSDILNDEETLELLKVYENNK